MTSDIISKMLGIGPATVGELTSALRGYRGTVAAIVAQMTAQGLVCDSGDRRCDSEVWRLV